MENTKNNVVVLRLRANLLRPQPSLATESRRIQQIVASGALATTLFLVTLVNLALSQNETSSVSKRDLASAQVESAVHWQKEFLEKVKKSIQRDLASFSARPSAVDQLRFGELEGKYALQLQNGKVTEVNYQETIGTGDRPKYVVSKEEFLNHYKDILSVNFESAAPVSETIESGKVTATYQLLGENAQPIAKALFVSDQYGRLMSFRVLPQ